jgi:hypothetical protein
MMLVQVVIPKLPHNIAILPGVSRWLVRITMFRARLIKHCFEVKRLSSAERRLDITIAALIFIPSVGAGYQI